MLAAGQLDLLGRALALVVVHRGAGIGNSTNSAGVAAQLATAAVNANTINTGTNIVFHIESPAGLAALERWARGGVR